MIVFAMSARNNGRKRNRTREASPPEDHPHQTGDRNRRDHQRAPTPRSMH
jgi:hypothetical protein